MKSDKEAVVARADGAGQRQRQGPTTPPARRGHSKQGPVGRARLNLEAGQSWRVRLLNTGLEGLP